MVCRGEPSQMYLHRTSNFSTKQPFPPLLTTQKITKLYKNDLGQWILKSALQHLKVPWWSYGTPQDVLGSVFSPTCPGTTILSCATSWVSLMRIMQDPTWSEVVVLVGLRKQMPPWKKGSGTKRWVWESLIWANVRMGPKANVFLYSISFQCVLHALKIHCVH